MRLLLFKVIREDHQRLQIDRIVCTLRKQGFNNLPIFVILVVIPKEQGAAAVEVLQVFFSIPAFSAHRLSLPV
jgi:hypothetical protein